MNIWIISPFEATPMDKTRKMRFAGIADAALAKGHKLTHISCTFRHATKFQRFSSTTRVNVSDNFEVIYIYSDPYTRNMSPGRLLSHSKFTRNLIAFAEHEIKPDVIVVTLPPLSTPHEVCKWGKKHNIPVIVDIIDPWPDVFLRLAPRITKPLIKTFFAPMYMRLHNIMRSCAGVISISNEYIDWAKGVNSQIKVSGAFFPAVDFKGVRNSLISAAVVRSENDPLRIIYAGNLASSYDLPCILRAAETLEQKYPGKTEFIICGVGPHATLIQEYAGRNNNIKYLGRLGADDLLKQYALADAGLTQHIAGATQSITYKFFDYLSAGLPILNSLQSEMAKLIADNNIGFNNKPGNDNQLVENVEKFLNNPQMLKQFQQNAVAYTAKNGDAETVYGKLIELLETVVNKQPLRV